MSLILITLTGCSHYLQYENCAYGYCKTCEHMNEHSKAPGTKHPLHGKITVSRETQVNASVPSIET